MYVLVLLLLMKCAITHSMLCNGVVFRDVYYDKFVLFEGLAKPINLVMHRISSKLFFSHTIQNGLQVDFGIMACHVQNKNCKDVEGVPGGYAISYDRGNNEMYFGGHDGIYKYNFKTNQADFFAEKGKSVWGLFIRRNFYYIRYPTQTLYVFKRGKFTPVKEAENVEIDHFFVTKQFEIYFSNRTGLYKVNKPREKPKVLDSKITVRQITYDFHGNIYFCAKDGIYMEDKPLPQIKKVADIHEPFGMAFYDAGKPGSKGVQKFELIYSDKSNIYLLLPSNYSDVCVNKSIVQTATETKSESSENLLLYAKPPQGGLIVKV